MGAVLKLVTYGAPQTTVESGPEQDTHDTRLHD